MANTAQKIADKVASTARAAQNTTRSAVNLATGNPAAAAKNQLDNVVAQATGGITGTLGGGSPSVDGPGGIVGFVESVAAQIEAVRCQAYEYCNNDVQGEIIRGKSHDWKKDLIPLVGKNGEPQAGAEIAFHEGLHSFYKRTGIDKKGMYRGNYQDFKDAIAFHESTDDYGVVNKYGYMGRYQMGKLALIDAGFMDSNGNWTELAKNYGVSSRESFLNNKTAQDVAFDLLVKKELGYINNLGLDKYVGQKMNDIEITESGLVAAIHLVGIGDTKEALEIGDLSSKSDKNGTTAKEYMENFGGYNLNEIK